MAKDNALDSVSFVCIAVNYRTTSEAVSFARSFASAATDGRAKLILVDNSDGNKAGELARVLPGDLAGVTCVDGGGNSGYFGGARAGLREMRARGSDPDWVAISNVDLAIDFTALLEGLAEINGSDIGVVAPRVQTTGAQDLNPFMQQRPSGLRMHAYKWICQTYPTYLAYQTASAAWYLLRSKRRSRLPVQPADDSQRPIYAAHGSFFVLSRAYLEQDELDHEPFLFGEEVSVAESAWRRGLRVIYSPRLEIVHTGRASIGNLPSRRRFQFSRDAARYCADQYFSVSTGRSTR